MEIEEDKDYVLEDLESGDGVSVKGLDLRKAYFEIVSRNVKVIKIYEQ